MDKRFAEIVINDAFYSIRNMDSTAQLIRENCRGDEKDMLINAISSSMYDIRKNIIEPLYNIHPELKVLHEVSLEKYGRFC